jgi:hypothetical protein
MSFEELKKADLALANAIAEIVGNRNPQYYLGFLDAAKTVKKDGSLRFLDHYIAFCEHKLSETPIVEPAKPDIPVLVQPKRRGRPKKNMEGVA